jgi:hypothetical protein
MIFNNMVSSRLSSFEAALNKRFDHMRELWRTELPRVEEFRMHASGIWKKPADRITGSAISGYDSNT